MKALTLFLFFFSFSTFARAELNVVATTANVGAIVNAVGGSDIHLFVIAKGTQDPHHIAPKPSYMLKVSRADLVVLDGLSLEIGWLPTLLRDARNSKVMRGQDGYLDLGSHVQPLEVPSSTISRANGDVHPNGNPHYTLDPIRDGKLALVVAARLGQLDPAHNEAFLQRAKKFQKLLQDKTKEWSKRIAATGVKAVISYHDDLIYFLNRFHIKAAGYLEPKPGIPPTLPHTLQVMDLIKREKIPLIMIETYFDPKVGRRIAKDIPTVKVMPIPDAVGGLPNVKSIPDLIETLVKTIESAKGHGHA